MFSFPSFFSIIKSTSRLEILLYLSVNPRWSEFVLPRANLRRNCLPSDLSILFYFLGSFREVISLTSSHYLSHYQRNTLILIRLCRNASWIFRSFLLLTSKIMFRGDCVLIKTFNFLRYLLPRSTSFLIIVVRISRSDHDCMSELRERNEGNFQRNETPN